jgi:hypothetical protein
MSASHHRDQTGKSRARYNRYTEGRTNEAVHSFGVVNHCRARRRLSIFVGRATNVRTRPRGRPRGVSRGTDSPPAAFADREGVTRRRERACSVVLVCRRLAGGDSHHIFRIPADTCTRWVTDVAESCQRGHQSTTRRPGRPCRLARCSWKKETGKVERDLAGWRVSEHASDQSKARKTQANSF